MHKYLSQLQPYPFQRLAELFEGVTPPSHLDPIRLSIGEPKHHSPQFVLDELADQLISVNQYPLTKGSEALRQAIAGWLQRRFNLGENTISPDTQVLPVNGTREALFAFAQCIIDSSREALVLMPNPFYQIYEGAALLSGAKPWFMNTTEDINYQVDLDNIPDNVWQQCQLVYACSPGNPTGKVLSTEWWQQLIELADKYDFVIAADECYSEIYLDEDNPPIGLLEVCQQIGRNDYSRCVVFHSLSKRSNLPGLRSGFVAGDAEILKQFLLYRTYHGCAMPPPTQAASIKAWQDEDHVCDNREQYREKFTKVLSILKPHLPVEAPEASFYLWPTIPGDNDEVFAKELYRAEHVTVLPGSYLSRDTLNGNPGKGRVRMALVASIEECVEAAERIVRYCQK